MLVLEETVMPMMMDAVVIILGCDHYYQQCSVASGSDQPQFPPGYHPRRAISIADKGKDPMVRADLVIEVVQRALSGAGTMIRDGGRPTDGRSAGQLPPRLSALIRP